MAVCLGVCVWGQVWEDTCVEVDMWSSSYEALKLSSLKCNSSCRARLQSGLVSVCCEVLHRGPKGSYVRMDFHFQQAKPFP
jgi:hypothetical protein